jgi:hypothetical protein
MPEAHNTTIRRLEKPFPHTFFSDARRVRQPGQVPCRKAVPSVAIWVRLPDACRGSPERTSQRNLIRYADLLFLIMSVYALILTGDSKWGDLA